ncbi:hem-containing dehydratase protein [Aspergillus aurantiobrunneus]
MADNRIYPLARPPGHKPPMERWRLEFPDLTTTIHTTYIGIQRHDSTPSTLSTFTQAIGIIQTWIDSSNRSTERFTLLEGDDAPACLTWVCYWSNASLYSARINTLNLVSIYSGLGKPPTIGLWIEKFTTAASRLETNYSGLDYLPGLARLPGSKTVGHTLTAYWGAARDRIPDSSHDLFPRPSEEVTDPLLPAGLGQRLSGKNNYDNLVHIRSGQFWENCNAAETEAYETTLEPTLRAGLRYVWENRAETGAMGLRFLRNHRDDQNPEQEAKETCAAGFFRNLEDLERWAKRHPSHLAIFNGAIRHAKTFGEKRKFRTWHEVSVLKKGEAEFEYVNCLPETGVIRYLGLVGEDL